MLHEGNAIKVYSKKNPNFDENKIVLKPKQILKYTFKSQYYYIITFQQQRKNKSVRFYNTDISLINNKYTIGNSDSLNPFFVTGLTDAEETFSTIVKKSSKYRMGWRVETVFQIGLHERDLELLKYIQAYFGGVEVITKPLKNMCAFRISSPE